MRPTMIRRMLLTLEVQTAEQAPMRGSLSIDGGEQLPFSGWLQLMSLLHQTLTPPPREPTAIGGTQ